MAQENVSVVKWVVGGVLVVIGALYLVRLVSWLLSLAIVAAALVGAGFIGYQIARVVLGIGQGKDDKRAALPAASKDEEVSFSFEEEDSEFMREMRALEAKERKVDAEIKRLG